MTGHSVALAVDRTPHLGAITPLGCGRRPDLVGVNENGSRGDCAQACENAAGQTARRHDENSAQEIARGIVGVGRWA